MKRPIVVRTGKDRLRYILLFEAFLIALLAPFGAMLFDRPIWDIGALGAILSVKAMVVNYFYNQLFDRIDVRAGRIPTERSALGRIAHAVGLEVGLVMTSLPLVIWWLGLAIWQVLLMDVAISAIVVVYTLVFTWLYDRLLPVRQPSIDTGDGSGWDGHAYQH